MIDRLHLFGYFYSAYGGFDVTWFIEKPPPLSSNEKHDTVALDDSLVINMINIANEI